MYVFLSNSLIILLSVIAVILTVAARFVRHRGVSDCFHAISFILVLASITYALLLGAKLAEVLIYVLAFSLIGAVSFLPGVKKNSDDSASCKNNDETVDEQ